VSVCGGSGRGDGGEGGDGVGERLGMGKGMILFAGREFLEVD